MKKIISILFLTSFVCIAAQAQKKVHFKINPELEKTLNYEMILKTDIAGAQNVMMDMIMGMSLTPRSIADTSATIEVKYSNVKMDINSGAMMLSYDSSSESDDPMSQALSAEIKPLLENNLTIVMDRSGKVKSVDFPNVSDQAFDKSSVQSFTVGYPNKGIAIGESWESNSTLEQFGLISSVVNTLTEKTADGYIITVKGSFVDDNGNEIGTMDGSYVVDPVTFFTKSSVTNNHLDIAGQKISTSLELKQTK